MQTTPRSLRFQIGLFGRTNVGKSTFLNTLTGQDLAITSPVAGTTTDPVEKSMELPPLGAVVCIDTGGLDDPTELGAVRQARTAQILERVDAAILLVESNGWSATEEEFLGRIREKKIPFLLVITKADLSIPGENFLAQMRQKCEHVIISALSGDGREKMILACKEALPAIKPEDSLAPALLDGVLQKGEMMVLLVPLDAGAPKGRLILPQVQVLRAALDLQACALTTTEKTYSALFQNLAIPPRLVVCDSQVVDFMVRETPPDIPCTTFSILFARMKADLPNLVRGALMLDSLQDGDKVLISEACAHHPMPDDIGRVKIPRWLREYTKKELQIDVVSGRSEAITDASYRLIIHCGACMMTRTEMLARSAKAAAHGIPMTNYGLAIAHMKGVLPRVISPFPEALKALKTHLACK